MPQRWIAAIFVLILAAGAGKSAPSVEYLTGIVRDIDQSNLTLDAGGGHILTIQLQSGIKYSSTMGKVKAADFEPGDHVTVEATRDETGQYSSKSVTMNKRGSADDKASAQAAMSSEPRSMAMPKTEATPKTNTLPAVMSSSDPVIEKARDAAFSFSDTLPGYVVKQTTNRYKTIPDKRGVPSWQPLDVVTTDLIYENGKDHYMNTQVNGRPTSHVEQTGSWSEGEFANMLQAVFSLDTKSEFRNQKTVTINEQPAWRYDYSVDQEHSTWTLHSEGRDTKPAYVGSVWIDKTTFRVLRMEMAAQGLPRDFPLDTSESSVDYAMVPIGDKSVLLPVDADSLSCSRASTECARDRTVYREYKKFEANSSITFDEPKQPR